MRGFFSCGAPIRLIGNRMQYQRKEVKDMPSLEDAVRAALNAEEAALLPALPSRRGIAGKIALRERIEAAERMKEMQLSGEFHDLNAAVRRSESIVKRQGRAALHHILRT